MEQKYKRQKRAIKVHDKHCQLGILLATVPQSNVIIPFCWIEQIQIYTWGMYAVSKTPQ